MHAQMKAEKMPQILLAKIRQNINNSAKSRCQQAHLES